MAATAAGAATAASVGQLLAWRTLARIASDGIIPIGLALLGDLFSHRERGRPLGWIPGA
jgi:MFS family permease